MAKNKEQSSIMSRRAERRANRHNGDVADWESVDAEILKSFVATVTSKKATVTFSYTRDGGAYYLSYYADGESEKLYIRPSEDLDATLSDEIEAWKEL